MVNDYTNIFIAQDVYQMQNHPGRIWGYSGIVRRRKGLGHPTGVNTGTVDGSVRWTPNDECMLGYPGCGGSTPSVYAPFQVMQPPRPGRPGMSP